MPARRSVVVLTTAAALVAAPIAIAAPASAAGPDSTAILGPVTFPDPTDEFGPLETTAECGTNAYNGYLVYDNLTDGSDGLYFIALDSNKQGTFSQDPTNNMGDPGDEISLTLECWTGPGSPVLLATSAPQVVTLTDVGATIAAADVEVDQPIVVTGSCGTSPADWAVVVVQYPGIVNESQLVFAAAELAPDGTYSFAIASAASAGFGVGEGFAQVLCGAGAVPDFSDGFPDEVFSIRETAFQVLAKSLPATGAALPTAPLTIALLAILAGAATAAGARIRFSARH